MPNKSISSGILRKFHSGNSRVNTTYYQNHQDKLFNKSKGNIGEGIHIGNLMTFSANHDVNKSANKPVESNRILKVNDKPQFTAPKGMTEVNNLFIRGQKSKNRDDEEINGG